MKVVLHNDGPELRGSERQLSIIARGLADRGHDVLVSCMGGSGLERELRRLGVATTRVRPRGDLDVFSALWFAWRLRREAPDVLLCSSWPRLFWATAAGRLAGVPRIVGRLGIIRPASSRWKYRSALSRLDALIVNSETVRDTFLESMPEFDADAAHIVWNATVTPAGAAEAGASAGSLRQELARGGTAVTGDTRLLVSVGSLVHRKGHDLVMRALARVPGSHLAIAGSGPDETELRRLSRNLGVAHRVHFLGRRDDVPALLAGADLFVLATRNDSLPNAMLEAMAAGTPVVVTELAGVRQALGPHPDRPPAGWTVPPEDVDALTDTLERALAALGTEDGARRVEEARRRVEEWFAPGRMVAEVETVLAGGAPDGGRTPVPEPEGTA